MNVATLDLSFINFPPAVATVGQRVKHALATLLALGLFTGALFLGWGWDDMLQLFAHPARATLLVALMLYLAFSVARARPLTQPLDRDRAANKVVGILFWLLGFASLLMVASSAFWDRRILFVLPGEDLTRYIGLGLFLAGLVITAWQRNVIERRRSDVPMRRRGGNRVAISGLIGGSCQFGLIAAGVGLPMVFLSKLGLAGGGFFAALIMVRGIWRARTLSVNDATSARCLEAA